MGSACPLSLCGYPFTGPPFLPCSAAGDHEVIICDVVAYDNISRPADASPEAALAAVEDVLYTSYLRQLGHMQ